MSSTTDSSFAVYEAQYSRFRALKAEIMPRNKGVLLDALEHDGIRTVVVHFDGYGDSGQVEDVSALGTDDAAIELPLIEIQIETAEFGRDDPKTEMTTLCQYVEQLTYELVASVQDGWENNDGAYGDLTIDVAASTITLDFNERYTASTNSTYSF